MVRTHTVLVDSRDREIGAYPDAGRYRVMLPRIYRDVVSARLLSAEVPSSFYVFTAALGNTTLQIQTDEEVIIASIPDGNYGPASMQAAIMTALNQASPDISWSLEISQTTLKARVSNNNTVEFGLTVAPGDLASALGFLPTGNLSSEGAELVSSHVVNLNPQAYVLLDIEELNGIDEGGLGGDEVGQGSFAKIPFNANSFEYVYLDTTRSSTPAVHFIPAIPKLDRLRVAIRFHDGRTVPFNGADHSFTLQLETRSPVTPPKNSAPIVADAASAAASAAAAATIAATRSIVNELTPPPPTPSPPLRAWYSTVPKRWWPWIFAVVVGILAGVIFLRSPSEGGAIGQPPTTPLPAGLNQGYGNLASYAPRSYGHTTA